MTVDDHSAVLETAGLTKIFKDFWHRDKVVAVRDLSVEIRRGEVFGLLGPNGSGKSTTIKMLLGLLYPTRGRLAVFGRPPTDVGIKARIGYLPEESYLYRFLDARETLDFYGRLFHLSRHERKSRNDQILEMVGLSHAAHRRVGEYSKGMARRIGLAQALINDPDFLILDEPTTGLDPIGTRQIKDLIKLLRDKGKTVLLSSHLLADVEDVCDRVCILYGGQQHAMGDIRELLSRKELTQITAERLQPETVDQIRALIDRLERKEIGVSSPSDKLENFFLRIVQEAQAASVQTSGAQTGKVAAFLGGPSAGEEDKLIESLVEAARSEPEEETPLPVPESVEQPEEEVLQTLVEGRPGTPVPTDSAETSEADASDRSEKVDRAMLDSLLDSEEEQGGA